MDNEEDLLGHDLYKASEDSDELNEDQEDALLGESDPEDEIEGQRMTDNTEDDFGDAEFIGIRDDDQDVLELQVEDIAELDKISTKQTPQIEDDESDSDDDNKANSDKNRGRFISERGSATTISTVVTTNRNIPDSLDNIIPEPKKLLGKKFESWNSNKRNEKPQWNNRGMRRPNPGMRNRDRNFPTGNNTMIQQQNQLQQPQQHQQQHHQQQQLQPPTLPPPLLQNKRIAPPPRPQNLDQQMAESRKIHINPNFKGNMSNRNEGSNWNYNNNNRNTPENSGQNFFNPSRSNLNSNNNFNNIGWVPQGPGLLGERPQLHLENQMNVNPNSPVNNPRQQLQNQMFDANSRNLPLPPSGQRNLSLPIFTPVNQENESLKPNNNRNFTNCFRNFNDQNVNNFSSNSNFNQGEIWKQSHQQFSGPNFQQHRGMPGNVQNNQHHSFETPPWGVNYGPSALMPEFSQQQPQQQHHQPSQNLPSQQGNLLQQHNQHHNQHFNPHNQFQGPNQGFKQQQQQQAISPPVQMLMTPSDTLQQFTRHLPTQPFSNMQQHPRQLMAPQPLMHPTILRNNPLRFNLKNDAIAQFQGVPLRNLDHKAPRPKFQAPTSALRVIQPVPDEQFNVLSQLDQPRRFPKPMQHNNPQQWKVNVQKRNLPPPQSPVNKQQKLMDAPVFNKNPKQNQSNMKEVTLVESIPASEKKENVASPTVTDQKSSDASSLEISPTKSLLPIEDEEDEQTKILRLKIEEQKKRRELILRQKEERRRIAAQERRREMQMRQEGNEFNKAVVNVSQVETKKPSSFHQPISFCPLKESETDLTAVHSVNEEKKKALRCQMGQKQSNLLVKTGNELVVGPQSKVEQSSLLRNKQNPQPFAHGKLNVLQSGQRIVTNNKSPNVNSKNVNLKQQSVPTRASIIILSQFVVSTLKIVPMVSTENKHVKSVLVENLAASTTEAQIRKMCEGIGIIQEIVLNNMERKAHIQFTNPHDAENFTRKFQRRMVDLSLINVSLQGKY